MFGYLAINKPQGLTSRDVVNRIQRVVRPVKVGHTGTLDPLATGVLLVALGPATRLTEFSHEQSKEYVGTFELHQTSDTLDVEGTVVPIDQPAVVSREALLAALAQWKGNIQQTPPKYSAINIGGKRAYDLARNGQEFTIPTRQVAIHDLELTSYVDATFELRIECSTGTYVRTLGSDIAKTCQTDAVMSKLTRTRIGPTTLAECIDLSQLDSAHNIASHLRPAKDLISTLPSLMLESTLLTQIRNGIKIPVEILQGHTGNSTVPKRVAVTDEQSELVGILEKSGDRYRSLRVFQNTKDMPQPKSMSAPHNPES